MRLFEIKEGFKKEITDVKKKNVKLDRRIEELDLDVAGLVAMLDDETGGARKGRDPLDNLDPKMRAKVLADKQKRQRELLRRKMQAGVDFIGGPEIKFSTKKDENSFFQKLSDKFGAFIDELKPFKKDVREIKANYDKSISVFFEMIQ